MISEVAFASSFSSFWRELLPTADAYVRNRNLALERLSPPLQLSDSSLRDAINELGFRLFCVSLETGLPKPQSLTDSIIEEEARRTIAYIKKFRSVSLGSTKMPRTAIEEALLLSDRTAAFVAISRKQQRVVCRPKFSGCGRLDACEGDLMWGSTLCEVKSGDRLFRSADLRQLLIYCALRYAEGGDQIAQLTLFNPRRGVYFSDSLPGVCSGTSGLSPSEVMSEIVEVLSEPATSR